MLKVYRILPDWAPMGGITMLGRVFTTKNPSPILLAHEAVHVEQQKRDGWRFYTRYVFSAKWRVRYEVEAYASNILAGDDIARIAKVLSGPLYLWPCSEEEAFIALVMEAMYRHYETTG